jgi:hypothetical protein
MHALTCGGSSHPVTMLGTGEGGEGKKVERFCRPIQVQNLHNI